MIDITKAALCVFLFAAPAVAQTSVTTEQNNNCPPNAPAPHSSAMFTPGSSSSASGGSVENGLPNAPQPKANLLDWKFYNLTEGLVAASIGNAETLHRCTHCTFFPAEMQRRGVTYGIGLPLDVATAYMTYKLREHGHRWWFVPAAALTLANGYVAVHRRTAYNY